MFCLLVDKYEPCNQLLNLRSLDYYLSSDPMNSLIPNSFIVNAYAKI